MWGFCKDYVHHKIGIVDEDMKAIFYALDESDDFKVHFIHQNFYYSEIDS